MKWLTSRLKRPRARRFPRHYSGDPITLGSLIASRTSMQTAKKLQSILPSIQPWPSCTPPKKKIHERSGIRTHAG